MNFLTMNATSRFKYLKKSLEEQKKEYDLPEDYYEWEQWSEWGSIWQTKSWFQIPNANTVNAKNNVKIKATNNLIRKVTDEVCDYVVWTWKFKTIRTNDDTFNEFLYNNNNDEILPEIVRDWLIYDIWIWKVYIDSETNEYSFVRLNPESVLVYRDELNKHKVKAVVISQSISEETAVSLWYNTSIIDTFFWKEDKEFVYSEYWDKDTMITMINWLIIETKINTFNRIPVIIIGNWCVKKSYVSTLIGSQDLINVNLSLEVTSNVMNLNPLTAIHLGEDTTIVDSEWRKSTMERVRTLNTGAGSAIVFEWSNWKIERIKSEWVNSQFLECVQRYVQDFYAQAKISQISKETVKESWVAVRLMMNQTIKFISSIRNKLTVFYEDLYYAMNWDRKIEISWSNTVFDDENEKLDLAIKYNVIWMSKQFIMKFMGYSEDEIAKEIAIIPTVETKKNENSQV